MGYKPQIISNRIELEEAYRELRSMSDRKWLFRGQRGNWPLKSSLERVVCDRFQMDIKELARAETRLLREFKRHFHRYSSYLPENDNTLEWLAFMQHHGAPTRLQDWTYSFNIALFFALENALYTDRPHIFAIDHNHCWKVIHQLHPGIHNELVRNDKDKNSLEQVLNLGEHVVCPLNALNLNTRQAVQQGVFLVPCDLTMSFENCLEGTLKEDDKALHVFELNLQGSPEFLVECLEELQRVNITRISLFPGLDGFAQSLANIIPLKYLWPWDRS
jgi:hypothetical protein